MEVTLRPGWEKVREDMYLNRRWKVVIYEKELGSWFVYMDDPEDPVNAGRIPKKPFAYKPFYNPTAAMAWGTAWAKALLPLDR